MVQLNTFQNGNVLQGSIALFESLGLKINNASDSPLPISAVLPEATKSVRDIFPKVAECYFVGTIDDKTLRGEDEGTELAEEQQRVTDGYQGMFVFAVDIFPNEKISRTEIAALNRAFNRASKAAPVALIVRYGDYISLSICERTAYKQAGHSGEKPGIVSLLRDINFKHPHRGHLDILEDMKATGLTTFDSLYDRWLKVFNNDTLTDRFYVELQNWFFWAIKNVSFPNDINDDNDDDKYNPENVIRLITRLVFVWFLKQKGLVPTRIFDSNKLHDILKDFDAESDTSSQYYRAILQNLFFATLNRKIGERAFAFDEGWSKNRSNQDVRTLYRFEQDFIWWDSQNPENSRRVVNENVLSLFSHVPYMNNSLFECLDNKRRKGKTYYWDGFSRNNKRQAKVPNRLFFTNEEIVDLTDSYLDLSENQKESDLRKYREVRVHGLINILSRYHFTIEENTPLDVDVALDPELLGKVFEQLLAAFNPETKKTARKSTGSYYTPRPIVQYMVNESIVAYLNRTVPSVPEDKVRLMLGYDQDVDIDLTDDQRRKLVEAVFNCRILDPACGSGAFPMGALQQLSHLLSRVDAGNRYWEDTVMSRAMTDVQKASHLDDENQEATKADIQEVFNMSVAYPDYARKLYLIENCIYGVDIQCIAVQISRLRFFISLLCEQKPTDNPTDNFGVRPLPNLEMKFVTANTLVMLSNADDAHLLFEDEEIKHLIDDLRQVRHNLFVATSSNSKKRYLERDARLREQIAQLSADNFTDERQQKIEQNELLLAEAESKLQFAKDNLPDNVVVVEEKDLFGNVTTTRRESSRDRELRTLTNHVNLIRSEIKKLRETAESGRASTLALARQLTDWNPYDQNVSSPFFDPDWMFGVKDGFDIVIGNPPYVSAPVQIADPILNEQRSRLVECNKYTTLYQKWDLYIPFMERGMRLLAKDGCFSMIVPFPLSNQTYGMKFREWALKSYNIFEIANLNGTKVFENATVSNLVLFASNSGKTTETIIFEIFNKKEIKKSFVQPVAKLIQDKKKLVWNLSNQERNANIHTEMNVLGDYCYISVGMVLNADEKVAKGMFKKDDLISDFYDNVHSRKYIEPKDFEMYHVKRVRYLEYDTDRCPNQLRRPTFRELYERPKLIFNRLGKLQVVLDKDTYYLLSDSTFMAIRWSDLYSIENKSISASIKRYSSLNRDSMESLSNSVSLEYLLAILNSKYAVYLLSLQRGDDYHIYPEHLRNIPIPTASTDIQNELKTYVDCLQISFSEAIQQQIDIIVYHLYNLTYEEVLIVDPETTITREEYDNHG